ncbi:MAG: SpoVR family protein [Deltaproteobacteria bacterium]|nr:SpoVR family protein [Deltaproteobacteria bacterium]
MAFGTQRELPLYLSDWQQKIEDHARKLGLDFFPQVFEVLSFDEMNEVAAYGGFPTRYPHWRWGMDYERLKKSGEWGLSRIYEMVINNNPAVAYLLEGNSLVDQKLVMAHVCGHNDFFKNNFAFMITDQDRRTPHSAEDMVVSRADSLPSRKWIDAFANHATRVRRHIERHGIEAVESFLDVCLSLENLIDPHGRMLEGRMRTKLEDEEQGPVEVTRFAASEYMQSFVNPPKALAAERKQLEEERDRAKKFPERPEKDVLWFFLEHAPLERWERDLLEIVRDEAYYFWPQAQTKIMNEGWASYWHSKIMTGFAADGSEIVDYADRNASVMSTAGGRLNPYKLGVELYRHIEERWNRGQFGREWEECDVLVERKNWDKKLDLGRRKIFEVRAHYTDVTFIDEFLTPDFVAEQKLYSFGWSQRNDRFEIDSRAFREVKEKLLFQITNFGSPFIHVENANHENRAELLLSHSHQGVDLDVEKAKRTLENVVRVWRRPALLQTTIEGKTTLLRFDGKEHTSKPLK